MTKEAKLNILRARENKIVSRGKHLDAPGALRKVRRQIAILEKQ